MHASALIATAQAMVAQHKGLLAIDESTPTCNKRFATVRHHQPETAPLYPLRFTPIYEYRLWGDRRLGNLLTTPLPNDGPIGEAWVLSDRDDHPSQIANGPLQGQTLHHVLQQWPEQMLGDLAGYFQRFPLLLKFLTQGVVTDRLACFTPQPGDSVFLPAGTVHALGGGVLVFEIQQNSDMTFRLYDWEHVDAKTGQPRDLQVDQALACIDFDQGALGPVAPLVEATTPDRRERIFDETLFRLW